MKHCVASYAGLANSGRCAIYSLRVDAGGGFKRRVTVELEPKTRTVIQARGPCNARPAPVEARWLRAWITASGLAVSSWARTEVGG